MQSKPEIVPFCEANMQVHKGTSENSVISESSDGRAVKVSCIEGRRGLFIQLYHPTLDGKTAELAFEINEDSAQRLAEIIAYQLCHLSLHRSKQHTTKGTTMPPNENKGHGKPNTGGSDESAGVPPAVPPYTDYSPEVPLPDGKILLLPVNISHHENPGGIMIQRQEYKVHAEPYFSEVLLPGETEYKRVGPWGPSVPVDGYQGVMELPLSGPEGNRGWRIVEDAD